MAHLIGIISDTHGLLRPQALDALRGVERILHAGDVGKREILDSLRSIAPVVAVRGNVDREAWTASLRETEAVEVGSHLLYMLHDFSQLDLNPNAAGFSAVIYGHSHQPSVEWRGGVLYLNPGSAGPRRFTLPVTLARLRVGETIEAEIVHLVE